LSGRNCWAAFRFKEQKIVTGSVDNFYDFFETGSDILRLFSAIRKQENTQPYSLAQALEKFMII
jgi:hypothetical protein